MEQVGYATSAPDLDAIFAALADPTRRAILTRLAKGEASVKDLAQPFAMSQPAVSRHLKVLEQAGLITRRADRQRRLAALDAARMAQAAKFIDEFRAFWDQSLDQLDTLLGQMAEPQPGREDP